MNIFWDRGDCPCEAHDILAPLPEAKNWPPEERQSKAVPLGLLAFSISPPYDSPGVGVLCSVFEVCLPSVPYTRYLVRSALFRVVALRLLCLLSAGGSLTSGANPVSFLDGSRVCRCELGEEVLRESWDCQFPSGDGL